MKYKMTLILLFFSLLAGCGTPAGSTKDEPLLSEEKQNVAEISIPSVNETDVTAYNHVVFINGTLIEDDESVLSYKDEIYLSMATLEQNISSSFAVLRDGSLSIRRLEHVEMQPIQIHDTIYLPLSSLENYFHLNHDILRSSGSLHIDTLMQNNINIDGVTYYDTGNPAGIDPETESPDRIAADGRGIWIRDDWIGMENDQGQVYLYEKSKYTIQTGF